jgi:serine/threonine protein kinase
VGATLLRPLPGAALAPRPAVVDGFTVQHRFVLEHVIGVGAMGQVWRAKDLRREQAQNARPYIALKLLNADVANRSDAYVGLEREASKAQALAHPNIITVYDFDYDAELQRAFISMELLDGRSLEELVRRNRGVGVTRADALPVIEGVTDGLAYAHRKGVVHCDLKPANVFLLKDGTPKILDFGIARATRADSTSVAGADSGGFQGYTLAYASGELVRDQDPVPADDVYSLGVVFYELLGGRHPFDQESAEAAEVRGLRPVPIRGLKGREWRAIERALSFERADRFADAGAFRRAFQGRSVLPRVLAAAVAVLAIAAALLWYRDWRANQPEVPFDQLTPGVQQEFLREVAEGDRAWQLVRTGQTFLVNDALDHYSAAYALHPKDPRAVAGLERSASFAIDKLEAASDREAARSQLEELQRKSAYLESYAPLRRALEHAAPH